MGYDPSIRVIKAAEQDVLDWGKADPTSKMRGQLGLFDIIGAKNAKVKMVILNEAGHFPYREYPEQFNQAVREFLKPQS